MKARSAKNKGLKLQNYVRDKIRDLFGLSANDVRSTTMGATGVDIQLSDAARSRFGFAVEAKSLARVAIYKFYDQARGHADKEGLTPLLIVKANRREPLAILSFEDFMRLLK